VTSAVPVSRSPRFAALAAAVSIALHGGGIALAARLEPRAVQAAPPLEVAFEVAEPPAAPPLPAPVPPAPAPRAMPALPPPSPAEPPPLPPPSEAPPPQAPAARPVPRVGISLSSTAVGGAFAVGVGNTLHGKASEIAADPAEVKPYAGPSTPPGRLSAQPRLLAQPEVPYPPEARKAGVEGKVVLALHIGRDGSVVGASVLSEPGSGLGEAARRGALRFRFSPALLEGEAVETEIRFTYTFVLE